MIARTTTNDAYVALMARHALVVATCFFGFGCGGPPGLPDMVPIRGTVAYNGKMLTEGTVIYAPTSSEGRQARGTIQADGSFRLTTLRENDGAQQGDYKIVVIALEPHPGEPPSREEVEAAGGLIKRGYLVPEKYTSAATTDLTDLVNDDHSGVMEIELKD
jgi:hypothetical protein